MKNLKVSLKGISPLIMHSCQCVNPLNPISRELKKYTSKRNKTEEDLIKISDLEWQGGAYWHDEIGLYIPGENVEATLRNGAKAFKKGKDFEKYVTVTEPYIKFYYGENLTKEQLIKNYEYRDTRVMNVQRSKVLRTRPRFDQWNITFNLMYDETKIDLDDIVTVVEYSGSYVGICDSRPRYGKFAAKIEEVN